MMGGLCCLHCEESGVIAAVVTAEKAVRPNKGFGGGASGSSRTRLIFQLGAAGWCTPEEPASASGSLHEAHHAALNAMENTACYSVYPSTVHDKSPGAKNVLVVKQPQVPSYKIVADPGTKSWHAMSNKEVEDYLQRLEDGAYDMMQRAEEEQECDISLAIVYHAFLGTLAMRRAIKRRVTEGLRPTPFAVVCEGEELGMYSSEQPRTALRFKAMLELGKIFTNLETGARAVVLPSEQTRRVFAEHFPEFPTDRTFISSSGYSPSVFHPQRTSFAEAFCRCLAVVEPGDPMQLEMPDGGFRKLVLFVAGDARDSSALAGAAARAAGKYELTNPDVVTIILFDGKLPEEPDAKLTSLKRTCLGVPRSHAELAGLYSAADVCVFLAEPEPAGRPLVECMACGTPVIGMASTVAMSLVSDRVGALITRSPDVEVFSKALRRTLRQALADDWKTTKAEACMELCSGFSIERRCSEMLKNIADIIDQ